MYESTSPYYELRQALRDNPILLVSNTTNDWDVKEVRMLERVNEGKFVAVLQNNFQISFLSEQYCELVYLNVSSNKRN
jgi:hypothetical protein